MTVEPIALMSGEHHFNEVVFDDVFVPDTDVLGTIGEGWHQVTAELSFERSGPERILTTAPLITAAIRAVASTAPSEQNAAAVGELLARLISLRQLSVSVARTLSEGGSASSQAALVKDLGTRFEQESVDLVADLVEAPDRALREMLDAAALHRPLFTLRGGTNEVLRGVVARGMGVR
jgi:alkylation response protein AidB-like acyl-CoA dehydrogenase